MSNHDYALLYIALVDDDEGGFQWAGRNLRLSKVVGFAYLHAGMTVLPVSI